MNRLLTAFIALLALSAAAWGDELTVTLDPTVEVYPSGADTAMCQTYGTAPCVDFSGTLTDNDTDGSLILLQTLTVTFDNSTAQADYFTQDNTFYDDPYPAGPPGLMSGDVNWVADGEPGPDTYTGVIFGIDIAPGTPIGDYTATAEITGYNLIVDPEDLNGFTEDARFAVDVIAPEPATGGTAMVAAIVAWRRHRRLRPC